ncbi:IVSP1-like protein [Lissonota sp. PSUC_FEM 10030012]|nr:IVSP1-like protein [Lissonota sp. PSUC_FEM 10030012]
MDKTSVIPKVIDSNDLANKKGTNKASLNKPNHQRCRHVAETIFYKYKLLGWLAVCLFSCGSISLIITTWSYIVIHSLLGAGSLMWMIHSILMRELPIFIQHVLTFSTAIYILIKHIEVGKYAYLTALLFCTNCAVRNHESLPQISLDICNYTTTNVSMHSAIGNDTYAIASDQHYSLCKLDSIMKILEIKLNVDIPASLVKGGLNGTTEMIPASSTTEIYVGGHPKSADELYLPAFEDWKELINYLEKKSCQSFQ